MGVPIPGQAGQDRVAGNVLDRFHHPREDIPAFRPDRRKGHAAVANQRRGHAVPGDRFQLRIPADLCVQVGVQVDKARRYHRAPGVDLAAAFLLDLADGNDRVARDAVVPFECRIA